MRAFGVVGGGAVLAFTAGLGGLALLTPLTGLAGVGALGNIKLKKTHFQICYLLFVQVYSGWVVVLLFAWDLCFVEHRVNAA